MVGSGALANHVRITGQPKVYSEAKVGCYEIISNRHCNLVPYFPLLPGVSRYNQSAPQPRRNIADAILPVPSPLK
jgi:hypothetical protein